jgi:hypothetical protein
MKTFKELRDKLVKEISPALATRYRDKALKDRQKLPGASDLGISSRDARKVKNRIKGSNRALDRAYGRGASSRPKGQNAKYYDRDFKGTKK